MTYQECRDTYVFIPKHWMSLGSEDLIEKKERLRHEVEHEIGIGKYQRKELLKQIYWIDKRLPEVKTIELLGGKIE